MTILYDKQQIMRKSFFVIIAFVLSSNIAVSSAGSKNGISSSTESLQKQQQLQDYIEKEILTDGTTLESLLQVEENERNGISTASETKHKLLSKTKNFHLPILRNMYRIVNFISIYKTYWRCQSMDKNTINWLNNST